MKNFSEVLRERARVEMDRRGMNAVEYAAHVWRVADRPWVPRQKEASAARIAQTVNRSWFQCFPCEMCKQEGHYCPATRYGFEQEGVKEHWCQACKLGFKCRPGTGEPHLSGRLTSHENLTLRRKESCKAT